MNANVTIIILIVTVLIAPSVSASTLLAVRSSQSVVLAADSKLTPYYSTAHPSPLPKIVRCGPYFVGFSGVRSLNIKNASFNMKETIVAACKPQATLQQTTRAISEAAKAGYINMYTALIQSDPEFARSVTSGAKGLMEANLILVGSNAGVPFISTIVLLPRLQDGTIVAEPVVSIYNSKLNAGACDYAFGGVYGDLWDLVASKDKPFSADHLLANAAFFVDYQISKTPDVSGYPIDVVEITAEGKANVTHCESACSW